MPAGEPAPAVPDVAPAPTPGPLGMRARTVVLGLLGAAVVAQLVVLYSPEGGGPPLFAQADKLVHLTVFLVPVALAVVAGLRRWLVGFVFAAHAVLSEVVQAVFLPHRSGDPMDAAADLVGVALGLFVGRLVQQALAPRGADRGAVR